MLATIDSTRILLFVGVAILVFGLLKDAGLLDNILSVVKEWVKYLQTKKVEVPVAKVEDKKEMVVISKPCCKLPKEVEPVTTTYLVKEWLDLRQGFDKAGVPIGKEKLDDMFVLLNVEKKG